MRDQADRLRTIISELKLKNEKLENDNKQYTNKSSRVIAVTSGKGGVGKTNITANLAIALSELGMRVVVIDADLGLSNIDVIYGIVPRLNLLDVIKNNYNILDVLTAGPANVRFISGGSGVEELIGMNEDDLSTFIDQIAILDRIFDIILIDTGGGISERILRFIMAANEILLVTTPEPTSLTDAYALIKVISSRNSSKSIKLLVNRAEDEKEAEDIINKLVLVAKQFLKIHLGKSGYIFRDESVVKAVKAQTPFLLYAPKSTAAKQIKAVSERLINLEQDDYQQKVTGIKNFFYRFVGLAK